MVPTLQWAHVGQPDIACSCACTYSHSWLWAYKHARLCDSSCELVTRKSRDITCDLYYNYFVDPWPPFNHQPTHDHLYPSCSWLFYVHILQCMSCMILKYIPILATHNTGYGSSWCNCILFILPSGWKQWFGWLVQLSGRFWVFLYPVFLFVYSIM